MKRNKLSHYPYQVPMLIGKKLTREVIEVVSNESYHNYLILGKIKKLDLVFHTKLMQTFPDWEARMNYQKKIRRAL